MKKKKIKIIKERFKSKSSLEALIENNDFLIETATAVNQQNPTIPGYGNEPYVIGAAFSLNENQTSNLLEGNRGLISYFEKKDIYKKLEIDQKDLSDKIEILEQKNSLLTENIDLDFIEILIREKFLFGKEGEITYITKDNGSKN